MIRAYLRTVYKDALSAHLEIIPYAYLYVSVCICSQIRFFKKRLLNFLCQLLQGYANVGLKKNHLFLKLKVLTYLKKNYFYCFDPLISYCLWGSVYHEICVEVKGQAIRVSSFVLPCGSWGPNTDLQTWQQVLLLTEPSRRPNLGELFSAMVGNRFQSLTPGGFILRPLP